MFLNLHRDAYDVCSLIPDPNERHQCYSVFGLDAHKMNNYYETVVRLEQQLSTDLDNTCKRRGVHVVVALAAGTATRSQARQPSTSWLSDKCMLTVLQCSPDHWAGSAQFNLSPYTSQFPALA